LEVGLEHVDQTLRPAVLLDVGETVERRDIGEGLAVVRDKKSFVTHFFNGFMHCSRARRSAVQKWDCTTNSAYVEPHHWHSACRAPTELRRNVPPPERRRIFGEIFISVEGVLAWPHGNTAWHCSSSTSGT